MSAIRTKYNKIVNHNPEKREVTLLEDTFVYSDSFKGATGSKFEYISEKEYKKLTSKKEVIERLKSCLDANWLFENGYRSYSGLYNSMKQNNEIDEFCFDYSYTHLHDQMRQELNLSEKEAYIFNCISGGRCFDKDYQGNINPELSKIIRDFESK